MNYESDISEDDTGAEDDEGFEGFEEGAEGDDFGDFDDGFQEAEDEPIAVPPTSVPTAARPPPFVSLFHSIHPSHNSQHALTVLVCESLCL